MRVPFHFSSRCSRQWSITDTNQSNNTSVDIDVVNADLAIAKTNGQANYKPGQTIVYAIVVSNHGPSDVTGATVVDNLPPSITNASWTCTTTAGSSCGAPGGTGNIAIAVNLLNGGRATFMLTGTVASGATGNLINTATVSPPVGTNDTNLGNNSATDTDTPPGGPVVGMADPVIVKYVEPALARPGEDVRYTITVTNRGSQPAINVVVADTVPDPLLVTSASASPGTYTISGNTVTFNVGTVNPGQVVTLNILARISPDAKPPLDVLNTATLTDQNGDEREASASRRWQLCAGWSRRTEGRFHRPVRPDTPDEGRRSDHDPE